LVGFLGGQSLRRGLVVGLKYALFRDQSKDVWILRDFWTNEVVLVSQNVDRLYRYVKMKRKLEELKIRRFGRSDG